MKTTFDELFNGLVPDKQIVINQVEPITPSKLILDKFTITDLTEYVQLEIQDYDYDSTYISIEDLKILYNFIGDIINKQKSNDE